MSDDDFEVDCSRIKSNNQKRSEETDSEDFKVVNDLGSNLISVLLPIS